MRAASIRAAGSAALELLDSGEVRRVGREPRIPVTRYNGHVTDTLRLDPGEVRHIGREPRIPVTGYDGLVTDRLRLDPAYRALVARSLLLEQRTSGKALGPPSLFCIGIALER